MYRGIQMRSRLEARFAAVLDAMHADWGYESVCYADGQNQYLPDFFVTVPCEHDGGRHEWQMVVEVKPTAAAAVQALTKSAVVWANEPAVSYVVVWRLADLDRFVGFETWNEPADGDFPCRQITFADQGILEVPHEHRT